MIGAQNTLLLMTAVRSLPIGRTLKIEGAATFSQFAIVASVLHT